MSDIKAVKDYLELMMRCRGEKPEGLLYFPEEFLLKHGREFTISEATFKGPRLAPRMCFMNATHMALDDESLTYCEGYTNALIPIWHAWVVDAEGRVLDPTLPKKYAPSGYFGVAFASRYLRKQLCAQKVYGLLNGQYNPNLLTGKARGWQALDKLPIAV